MKPNDYELLVNLSLSERQKPFLLGDAEQAIVERCYNESFTVAECAEIIVQSRFIAREKE